MEDNSLKELEALIRYLVDHNVHHTEELEELAESLKKNNKDEAYAEVLSAIESYREGNKKLSSALDKFLEK